MMNPLPPLRLAQSLNLLLVETLKLTLTVQRVHATACQTASARTCARLRLVLTADLFAVDSSTFTYCILAGCTAASH